MNKRLNYIDYAKGIGMFCVIWGHIYFNTPFHNIVYSFHIPLFFFLSGMNFSRSRYPSLSFFIKRKIKTLLIPYLKYSFFFWGIWAIISWFSGHTAHSIFYPFLQIFIAQGSDGFLVHDVPLWFIPCLFLVEFLYFPLSKLDKKAILTISVILAVISYLLICHIDFYDFTLLPWSLDVALASLVFYAVGNLVRSVYIVNAINGIKDINHILLYSLLLFLVCSFVGNQNGFVSMAHGTLGNNPLVFYLNAFVGIAAVILLCLYLSKLSESSTREYRVLNVIKWWGQNSFALMALHNPIKGALVTVVSMVSQLPKEVYYERFIYSFVFLVLTLLLSSLTIALAKRARCIS